MTSEASTGQKPKPAGKPKTVKVTVTFPLSAKGPYKGDAEEGDTAEVVRTAAMTYFGTADDATATYYLTHKGDRVAGTETVGELADEARAVKFTLTKDLIQG